MFLKRSSRKKDGQVHEYWSIVENRRVAGGRVRQRHVLYLGEINSTQQAAWRKTIDLVVAGHPVPRTIALFAEDRLPAVPDDQVVAIRLSDLQLHRPRQWGACWLTDQLWLPARPPHLLASTPAAQPQRHPLGPRPPDARHRPPR